MADRKVRYVLEVDYEGGTATARAADDLREVDDAAKKSADGLSLSAEAFGKLATGLVGLGALGAVKMGLEQAAAAAQFFYESISQGADLMLAEQQFGNLAASIGTTADALQVDLQGAVGGLMTSAEMMAGAGQLMSLGLANTHDEAVALSEVSAKLGWDIQVLGLTIANQSTARLDALGLSIQSVTGRLDDLKAKGMSADEAFKWAIIEAGREKIEIVGDVSDTTAGKLEMLESIVRGTQEAFALGAAEGFAESLGLVASAAPAAGEALQLAARGASAWFTESLGAMLVLKFAPELAYLIDKGKELEQEERRHADAIELVRQGRADLAEMTAIYGDVLGDMLGKVELSADAADYSLAAWAPLIDTYQIASAQAAMAAENGYYLAESLEAQAERAAELSLQQQIATAAAAEWARYTAAATATGGDYFTMFSGADEAWNFSEAVYAAADAAGAGAGPLADLAVSMGLIDQATADAATAAAQQQVIAENLAGAAADGMISWENYATAVQRAIDVLNGAQLVELGPREMPEMEDRGFREGYQEQLAQVVNEYEPIPIEVELERESIQAAVDEARGIVEGFTNPEDIYEAVVTMNIDDVETGAGKVKELIEGIPDVKDVRINVTATGMDILEELRALGALP